MKTLMWSVAWFAVVVMVLGVFVGIAYFYGESQAFEGACEWEGGKSISGQVCLDGTEVVFTYDEFNKVRNGR